MTQYKYIERFIGELGLTNIVFVLHDWGGGLGLNYAMRHEADVRGIALWETFVRTFESWDDWPQDLLEGFKAFRTPDVGWDMIVNKNVFMEEVLPYGVHRDLTEAEMKAYLDPHRDPANRKTLWVWPQELPIEGQPEDTARIIKDYVAKLGRSQVPKLLFWALSPAPSCRRRRWRSAAPIFPTSKTSFSARAATTSPRTFRTRSAKRL